MSRATATIAGSCLLTIALCGVAVAQKPNSSASKAAAGQATENSKVKIGVTDSAFDDIGSVLNSLNVKFQLTESSSTPLTDFNCLFVGCGTSERGKFPAQGVKDYVQRGGVLYVSDLAYPVLQDAFPDFVRNFQQTGQVGTFNCNVLDKRMAKDVGPQITLNFDAPGWAAPSQVNNNVQVLIAMQQGGGQVPVLITFKFGRGRVVYTSFHNHANANALELKLIRNLVEAPLVAAREIQGELRSGSDVKDLENLGQGKKGDKPAQKMDARRASSLSVDELAAAVSGLDAASQEIVLAELHDRKGSDATAALAKAANQVESSLQAKARDLLVKRLSRLTAKSLAGYLSSDVDAAVKLAAAKAASGKDDAELTAQLVSALESSDRDLADAAHESLTKSTGQNFGPFVGAKTDQRFVTARKWKNWWMTQNR